MMTEPGQADWDGHAGHIDKRFLNAAVPDIALHRAHICGPKSMMDVVQKILLDLGVPAGQIKKEAFVTDRCDPTRKAAKSGKVVGEIDF